MFSFFWVCFVGLAFGVGSSFFFFYVASLA